MNSNQIIESVLKTAVKEKLFYTPQQIKRLFEKLPEEKKQEVFEKVQYDYSSPKEEKTLLHKILVLCKKIVSHDVNFENKNSEIELAKKYANEIQEQYDELVKLVEQVELKDIEIVKEMLKMLDHPWMRVLGDQLKYKDNLEDKLKKLSDHISLKTKKDKHDLDKKLEQYFDSLKIPRDQLLDVNTLHDIL